MDRIGAGVGIQATPDGDIPPLTLEDSPAAKRGTEALLARLAVSALRSMSRRPPVNPPEGKLQTLGARAEAMHVLLKADIVVRGHVTYYAVE